MKSKLAVLFALAFASLSFAQAATTNTATVGDDVTLTSGITPGTGTPPLRYEWYKNGVKQDAIGTTSAILEFASVQLTDAGTWKVDIINSAGHTVTNEVVFTVAPAVIPPAGGSLTFSKKSKSG